ncbi:hypothetical protein CR513_13994, partial [Mucuna pruriens]
MLPYALHGYRTSISTSTRATPYSLVYGTEAVLLVEVEIPSLRFLAIAEVDDVEWIQNRLYQRRIKNTFDRRVRPRAFKEGDLVLKKRLPSVKYQRGKWAPIYKGPYTVKHAFSRGTLVLVDFEGQKLRHPVNTNLVKLFYP